MLEAKITRKAYGKNPRYPGFSMAQKLNQLLGALSHRNFHWLSTSAWEDADIRFFAQERPKPLSSLFSPLPFIAKNKKYSPTFIGRWILHLQDQTPRVWIELHHIPKAMDVMEVLVGSPQHGAKLEEISEALSFFFSALFLTSQVDQICGIIYPEEILHADKFAPYLVAITHLIPDESGIPGLQIQEILKIPASQWLGDEAQALHIQALNYLRQREERQFGGKKQKKTKKKLPLFLRKLFGWKEKPGRINA